MNPTQLDRQGKKALKIILANAPLQNGNRGCVALTVSAICLLDKVLSEKGINYSIYLPDAQINSWDFHNTYPVCDKEYQITPINYDVPYTHSSSIKFFLKRILNRIKGLPDKANFFKSADYVLNLGQGDSYADIYGIERFNQINRAYEIARYYHIPYCILPQTIGPFSNKNVENKARQIIQGARLIMVRDKQSCDYTKQLVPSCNVKEYIDVAFFLPYKRITQDANIIHVGLNVSALLWNGGYTRDNQFGLKCDYRELIRLIINYFMTTTGVMVHLVPHVVEPEAGIENDYEVSYNIWRDSCRDKVILAPFALNPVDVKSYIAGLDFFIGARMHATIAAFSSGVPVVPMAYSRKFSGLFDDTLSYHHLVDMRSCNNAEAISSITDSFSRRSELKSEIDCQNRTVVMERGKMMEDALKDLFQIQ